MSNAWNGPNVDKKISGDLWRSFLYVRRRDGQVMPGNVPESMPFVIVSYDSGGVTGA